MKAAPNTKVSLGSVYDQYDQGRGMVLAAFGWLCFLSFVTLADHLNPASIFTALYKFGALLCIFPTLAAFWISMPRQLRVAKTIVVTFACLAELWQMFGVFKLMSIIPSVSQYFNSLLTGQLMYTVALIAFGYCLHKHPKFPSWMGIGLALDGLFWMGFYYHETLGHDDGIWPVVATLPFLALEAFSGVWYLRTGLKMLNTNRETP